MKETNITQRNVESFQNSTSYGGKHKGKNTQHRENVESCKNSTKAGARNAELMKKFEDAQKRVEHVQESTQRLEEKLSNIESENQVLCQQAPTMSPTGKSLYARPRSMIIQEVDIIKKAENQAKMTKLSMEWKRLCKIKAKVQKCQSQSQYRRISSQTGAGTEEYY
ncbi:hypothetical protein Tco_0570729 [Tanacetum coccineum]